MICRASDIITELRAGQWRRDQVRGLCERAANEIERLRCCVALNTWKKDGGTRSAKRPDGIPTRIDQQWMSKVELAINKAMIMIEHAGASKALTDAVTLLSQARDRVADHVEGQHD